MATMVSEGTAGGRAGGGLSSGQHCQSSDALTEWRSSEQVENGIPSTSPPYWDTDDSDDDGGSKPPELYGKYTWKIEKFSQITKRELRSNAFEVGGYKWYILIYPQGCDVCNHLSLFLCVANHDKLLPGWSHFAQFTIAVVNKDPKKSKYSDTLHRFCKKEHDWGWKKFMELSKVSDGFVDADTLIIKAQVQVIREKADRPFRCLDCQYRRELVRVYLTNVEQICRRFVEERRGKLEKLIEDKARWSSFCAFWLGMDQSTRRRMSREKKDTILKVVVKHFFVEKEVTSTLVMDSLYSGLKALEGQSKSRKGKAKLLEGEEAPPPIIRIEKDMFVLVDDVLLLLEKAAMEPLPPKDDKGPQNRTKDGGTGEDFNKDSIERDERRLTELGRRTVEIFVLAHVFSNNIEVAYQEAVALRRQEELIREEEAEWLAESGQKAKRGVGEKDKKSKKKQSKQKRNNRKEKEKLKAEKPVITANEKQLHENLSSTGGKDTDEPQTLTEKDDILEDTSDVSDTAESPIDILQPYSEDRSGSPVNWDTDTSEIQPPAEAHGSEVSSISTVTNGGVDKRSSSVMDDSSSTCSTDSAPSVVMNGSYRPNSFVNYKSQKSPARGKNQRGKATFEGCNGPNDVYSRQPEPAEVNLQTEFSPRRKVVKAYAFEGVVTSLQDKAKWPELNSTKKEDEILLSQRKQNNKVNFQTAPEEKSTVTDPLPKSPPRNITSVTVHKKTDSSTTHPPDLISPLKPSSGPQLTDQSPSTPKHPKIDSKAAHPPDLDSPRKPSSNGQQQIDQSKSSPKTTQPIITPKIDSTITNISKHTEKPTIQHQAVGLSRPSSAPVNPPAAPPVSMTQMGAPSLPFLSRSVSATRSLNPDPSPYVPKSYWNTVSGNRSFSTSSVSGGFSNPPHTVNSGANSVYNPMFYSRAPDGVGLGPTSSSSGVNFSATLQEERLSGQQQRFDQPHQRDESLHFDMYRSMNSGSRGPFQTSRQIQSPLADEFPHLDIINDLLDDEQVFPGVSNSTSLFNRQFNYPTDTSLSSNRGSGSGLGSSGYQQDYGPANPYDSVREFVPQGNFVPYMNGGQIDSMGPNQWQSLGPDLSLMGLRSSSVDGYSYKGGVNNYAMFRPSNGH